MGARQQGEPADADAQFSLGLMYFNGEGVPQDLAQANAWFNIAAAAGLEPAREARDTMKDLMTPEQIVEAQRLSRELFERLRR